MSRAWEMNMEDETHKPIQLISLREMYKVQTINQKRRKKEEATKQNKMAHSKNKWFDPPDATTTTNPTKQR